MTHYKVKPFKLRNDPKVQWADYYEDGYYFEDRFILVPVEQIHFNKWNQQRYDFYIEAFDAGRPAEPVRLARPWNGGNHYEVSDGNHRIAASIAKGYTHVPAIVSVKIEGSPPKGNPPKNLYEEVYGRELLLLIEYLRARVTNAGMGAKIYLEWGGLDASGYWIKVSDESKDMFHPYESKLTVQIRGDNRTAEMPWQSGRFSYRGDLDGMKREFVQFMKSEARIEKVASMFFASIPRGIVLMRAGDAFSIRGMSNRRFMYNPKTAEILFGGNDISRSSHAEEWHDSGAAGDYDDCVRGWIGYGGRYRDGVIHFAPEIGAGGFNSGWDSLLMFKRHGATDNTVIRNFLKHGEETLGEILNPSKMKRVALLLTGNKVVSSNRTAGLLQPPPVMEEAISTWAEAMYAAHRAASQMSYLAHFKGVIDEMRGRLSEMQKEPADLKDDEGNDTAARMRELKSRIADYEKDYDRAHEKVSGFLAVMRAVPGLQPKKWKRISRTFKVDTTGWRYEHLLRDATPERLAWANSNFGSIRVELTTGNLRDASAYWIASKSLIRAATGDGLRDSIGHELSHWAQDYMRLATGFKDFGRPSLEVRTPDVVQSPTKEKKKMLVERGINPDEFHSLDDSEFYTNLAGQINAFRRKHGKDNSPDKVKAFMDESSFFKALRKHSVAKWQKAVREFLKEVQRERVSHIASAIVATRPIPIDRGEAERCVERLIHELRDGYWSRHAEEPLGDAFSFVDKVMMRDVSGKQIEVVVQIKSERRSSSADTVLGGGSGKTHKTKRPAVLVVLNGAYTPSVFTVGTSSKRSKQEILKVLMHELTHSEDIFTKPVMPTYNRVPSEKDMGDELGKYYNSPGEIHAYMREVFEDIRPYFLKLVKAFGHNEAFRRAIKLSQVWKERILPHMSGRNRDLILKGVYQAVEDMMAPKQMAAGEGGLHRPHLSGTSRWVKFDDLPKVTQEDIAAEIEERFGAEQPIYELRGLARPPVFLVRSMPIHSITGYRRDPSEVAVDKYVKMLEHSEAPPILVDGNKFIDGGHRFAAYVKAGRDTIPTIDVGRLFKLWPEWAENRANELEEPE